MPVVSASATPWTMNSTPMNVARLRIVQSMLKIRKPATTSSAPLSSSTHQLLAICWAASRVSLYPNLGTVPGAANMMVLR
jgi:hypothetical protein